MSNPNGANQYQLDPRQKLCWDSYIDPKSDTFGNGLQSAIKAGYDPAYANQITTIDWFVGKVRRLNMLDKAEKVLDKTLTYDPVDPITLIVKTDLLRVQTDVAKHITKTLGKEDYSERIETTGKDGVPLQTSGVDVIEIAKQLNELRRNSRPSITSDGTSPDTMDRETSDKE